VAPYSGDNQKVARLNSLLVQLVCCEGLPLCLVETEAFKVFVHELDPRYALPTRRSHALIPSKYEETKAQVQESLDQAQSVSITNDMWTSSVNEAYMGITGR